MFFKREIGLCANVISGQDATWQWATLTAWQRSEVGSVSLPHLKHLERRLYCSL
jgi:hypothetical protein